MCDIGKEGRTHLLHFIHHLLILRAQVYNIDKEDYCNQSQYQNHQGRTKNNVPCVLLHLVGILKKLYLRLFCLTFIFYTHILHMCDILLICLLTAVLAALDIGIQCFGMGSHPFIELILLTIHIRKVAQRIDPFCSHLGLLKIGPRQRDTAFERINSG